MAKFQKGNPGGGRPKGSKSKTSEQIRSLFVEIVEGELENVKTALANLRSRSPKLYLDALVKLSDLILPKPQITTVDAHISGDVEHLLAMPAADLKTLIEKAENDDKG